MQGSVFSPDPTNLKIGNRAKRDAEKSRGQSQMTRLCLLHVNALLKSLLDNSDEANLQELNDRVVRGSQRDINDVMLIWWHRRLGPFLSLYAILFCTGGLI